MGVIAVSRLFFEPVDVRNHLEWLLSNAFPGSGGLVAQNVEAVFRLHGAPFGAFVATLPLECGKLAFARYHKSFGMR